MLDDVGMYMIYSDCAKLLKIGVIGYKNVNNINVIEHLHKKYRIDMPISKIYFFPSYLTYKDTLRLANNFKSYFSNLENNNNNNSDHIEYRLENFNVLYNKICDILETMADCYELK